MLFAPRLVDEAIVSIQNAVVISDVSEPDVTLLKFREDFYFKFGNADQGEKMKPQIDNCSTNKILFTKKFFYTPSFEVKNVSYEDDLPAFQLDKAGQDFEEILLNKELAKEMFPPNYFMLVE